MKPVRILCLDLIATPGHVAFNRLLLEGLACLGQVSLAAPPDYLEHFSERFEHISLPGGIPIDGPGIVKHRINQALRWYSARRVIAKQRFDAILVLGYEPVTSYLLAPRDVAVWSIEHNTIEQAVRSRLKGYCFRNLPPRWRHFVFFDYLVAFLRDAFDRSATTLPFPLLPRTESPLPKPRGFPAGKRVFFSPSRSNDWSQIPGLESFLVDRSDCILAAKGQPADSRGGLMFRDRYEDYEAWLEHSFAVLFSGDFAYRASGVVYDALSHDTPVILSPSRFADELRCRYPAAVEILASPERLPDLEFDRNLVTADCQRLQADHSPYRIKRILAQSILPDESPDRK
jgi:hypothetical protein